MFDEIKEELLEAMRRLNGNTLAFDAKESPLRRQDLALAKDALIRAVELLARAENKLQRCGSQAVYPVAKFFEREGVYQVSDEARDDR